MQCFQKDPNLRVSARKLLKHAWIVGSRRSDAPVSKPPANFNEAVEEVKQWNEALRSPNTGSLRASSSSANSPLPIRKVPSLRKVHSDQQSSALATPAAKGPLTLVKPRNTAEAFRSPESTGNVTYIFMIQTADGRQRTTTGMTILPPPYRRVLFNCHISNHTITLEGYFLQTGSSLSPQLKNLLAPKMKIGMIILRVT